MFMALHRRQSQLRQERNVMPLLTELRRYLKFPEVINISRLTALKVALTNPQ